MCLLVNLFSFGYFIHLLFSPFVRWLLSLLVTAGVLTLPVTVSFVGKSKPQCRLVNWDFEKKNPVFKKFFFVF